MAGQAVVVPEGSLSKFLGGITTSAKYTRKGGLYVTKVRARNPNSSKKKMGFQGQGARR